MYDSNMNSDQEPTSSEPLLSPQEKQSWLIMGETFTMDSKYQVVDYLGAGAYGTVCAAQDKLSNKMVAIKKCKKIFQSRTLAKRILREIRLLRILNHENIIDIDGLLIPNNLHNFNELYIVFQIMETDLAQIIRSPQILRDEHIQYFTYQIACGLAYLHGHDVVHRDLKPRNILVNSNCLIKIADFGLSRIYNERNCNKIVAMTEYVTTRWYRAPEILVGWGKYTASVDVWALGTILAELIGRTPMLPGGDSVMQIDLIIQHLGKPPESFIQQCKKPSYRHYLRQQPDSKPMLLSDLYPEATSSPQSLDLLKSLLVYDPVFRLTAEQSLKHPYLYASNRRRKLSNTPAIIKAANGRSRSNSNISAESNKLNIISNEVGSVADDFDFEEVKLSVEEYREEILYEINLYHNNDTIQQMLDVTYKLRTESRKEQVCFSHNMINGNSMMKGLPKYHTTLNNSGAHSCIRVVNPHLSGYSYQDNVSNNQFNQYIGFPNTNPQTHNRSRSHINHSNSTNIGKDKINAKGMNCSNDTDDRMHIEACHSNTTDNGCLPTLAKTCNRASHKSRRKREFISNPNADRFFQDCFVDSSGSRSGFDCGNSIRNKSSGENNPNDCNGKGVDVRHASGMQSSRTKPNTRLREGEAQTLSMELREFSSKPADKPLTEDRKQQISGCTDLESTFSTAFLDSPKEIEGDSSKCIVS